LHNKKRPEVSKSTLLVKEDPLHLGLLYSLGGLVSDQRGMLNRLPCKGRAGSPLISGLPAISTLKWADIGNSRRPRAIQGGVAAAVRRDHRRPCPRGWSSEVPLPNSAPRMLSSRLAL